MFSARYRLRLTTPSLQKITPACQDNSPEAWIAHSSSINAVNLSSARTTKRFPSSRCASAIQIFRPLESIAETQPQLHPVLRIVDHLRRRFVQFKLGAHLLQASTQRFMKPRIGGGNAWPGSNLSALAVSFFGFALRICARRIWTALPICGTALYIA